MTHKRLISLVALVLGVVSLAFSGMSCTPSQTGSPGVSQQSTGDSQVTQAWVAQYKGLTAYYSNAYCIAVDQYGNVVVTGESNADCVTRKIRP